MSEYYYDDDGMTVWIIEYNYSLHATLEGNTLRFTDSISTDIASLELTPMGVIDINGLN